jgi:putative hydrolase of the HAD superfamily
VKAVFFDAGGTLLHIDYERVARVIAQVLGRTVTPEAFVEAEYAARDAVEAAMAAGMTGTDEERWRIYFRAMLGALGLGEDEFARVSPAIAEEHRRRHLWTATRPGTAEALAELRRRGFVVAVISNADGGVERLLEGAGLRQHLEFVVDSGLVGVEKPDPRIFRIALDRSGVAPQDACYVGDLYPVDVVGARQAGLEPVLMDPLGRYGGRDCRTARDVPAFCRQLVSTLEAA